MMAKLVLLFLTTVIFVSLSGGHRGHGEGRRGLKRGNIGKSYGSSNPVIQYAKKVSTPLHPLLEQLLRESVSGAGGMTGAPEVVNLNMMLIRAIKGRKALDVGLLAGFSAVGSALAVPEDGKVIGMDITDTHWNQIGKRYAQQLGVLNKIDVQIGPASETMDTLIRQGQSGTFDFCFIDADKTGYDRYYEQCLTLLRSGGFITLDNALWGGRVVSADPTDTTSSDGTINTLNMKVANDTRVWGQMLTIGDGLMVVLKK